jgi:hypothetical protein
MKISMKKSILLNEDEKNRILNLHETAKNLYENKKPVSSVKEDKTKKEDMKKVIKLTESDLEKIVRRVIEEQYMGVAFGGEQNGLKIKKVEATEQTAPAKTPTNMTPSQTQMKPTYKDFESVYYVPGLNDDNLNRFAHNPNLENLDAIQLKNFYQNNLGVKSTFPPEGNPFAVPNETYQNGLQTYEQAMIGKADMKNVPAYVKNFYSTKDALGNVMMAYLKNWRPNLRGVDVIKSQTFQNDPAVVNAKKIVSNLDAVVPKLIQIGSKASGLNVA